MSEDDILYFISIVVMFLLSYTFKNEALNKCLKDGHLEVGEEIIICKRMVYK